MIFCTWFFADFVMMRKENDKQNISNLLRLTYTNIHILVCQSYHEPTAKVSAMRKGRPHWARISDFFFFFFFFALEISCISRLNPHLPSGLFLINWTSPFPILGVSGVFFSFFILFRIDTHVFLLANSEDPDLTPRSAASDLGLHCLPMSKKWDARLVWVRGKFCFWDFSSRISIFKIVVGKSLEKRKINRPDINVTYSTFFMMYNKTSKIRCAEDSNLFLLPKTKLPLET